MPNTVSSTRTDTLSKIADGRSTPEHHPVRYRIWVPVAESQRWGEVTCSCGSAQRMDWTPTTETFLELLKKAWLPLVAGSEAALA